MILTNIVGEVISIVVILIILILVILYIIKAKKRGQKCIGCPQSKTCSVKNLKKLCCNELNQFKNEEE